MWTRPGLCTRGMDRVSKGPLVLRIERMHSPIHQAVYQRTHPIFVSAPKEAALISDLRERFWPPSIPLTIVEPPGLRWVTETDSVVTAVAVKYRCKSQGRRPERNFEGRDDGMRALPKDIKPDPRGFLKGHFARKVLLAPCASVRRPCQVWTGVVHLDPGLQVLMVR